MAPSSQELEPPGNPERFNMQTLHRVRDQLIGERTALMNQIRAILLERGHVVP
jgi:transposase